MSAVYRRGFDAHTHLGEAVFDNDRIAAVRRAQDNGVSGIAMATGDPVRLPVLRSVASQLGVVLSEGLHPWWVRSESTWNDAIEQLNAAMPRAVGEIGLDRLRPHFPEQQAIFTAQLDWARDHDRSVVVHAVRTVDEVLSAVAKRPGMRVMIHGFVGSVQQVHRAADLGVHLSLGPRTLRATGRTVDAVRAIPSALLLLETDCPHQPLPGRTRGEPSDLVQVAQAVAQLRDVDPVALFAQTGDTARRFFGEESV